MNRFTFLSLISLIILYSCQNNAGYSESEAADTGLFSAREILLTNNTSTVDIEKYFLVGNSGDNRKDDADAIMDVKRMWPLAMQSKRSSAFDSILSKNFVFTGGGHLLNRQDYINDRTTSSEWRITHVSYENMTLQFFGNLALLTYKNRVINENPLTKAKEIENISWADVYIKEDNKWKIDAAHVVDFSVEK